MSRLIVLLVIACSAASCGPDSESDRLSREAFLSAVKGKTTDEVISTVGRPDRDSSEGPSDTSFEWTYLARTYDRDTGETDQRTAVRFRGVLDDPDGEMIIRASGITWKDND